MRVSIYIIAAVLVTALGGLGLGAMLLNQQQDYEESNQRLSQQTQQQHNVERFADQIKNLLLSTDLLFDSQETYMLDVSATQANSALAMCNYISSQLNTQDTQSKSALQRIHTQLERLGSEITQTREQAFSAYFSVSSEQLRRIEAVAIELGDNIAKLQEQSASQLLTQQEFDAQTRSRYNFIVPVSVSLYIACVFLVLWWASRSVSRPISHLSRTAHGALHHNSQFEPSAIGPVEVRELTGHIEKFVDSLQQKIDQNHALLKAIPDTLFFFDRTSGIELVKSAAISGSEYNSDAHSWPRLQNRLGEGQVDMVMENLTACLDEQTQQQFDVSLEIDGSDRFFEARATPVTNDKAVIIIRDLTNKRLAESRIHHMAYHDTLTGLLNRRAFKEHLTAQFQTGSEQFGALLFIDVDRFKTINDTRGHEIGDEILQHVSNCLVGGLRTDDIRGLWGESAQQISARMGGDEFVVLLPEISDAKVAESIANRLLAAIATPLASSDSEVFVTASIGLALFPADGETDDELVKHADLAMFEAKRAGGNKVCVYEKGLGDRSKRKLSLETKLRKALENKDLFLTYQPKIAIASGQIIGAEALVRWQDGDKVIPPNEFIPLAEETGLILPLGDFVIETAIDQMASWREAGIDLDHIAINVSAAQLKQHGFGRSLLNTTTAAGLSPHRINIEITESLLLGQYDNALGVLHDLSSMGFTISMDDFGTGYSSLSYIKDLPLNVLKIDKAFVSGVADWEVERAIIAAIVQLGQTLGLRIVAEGVETEDQRRHLEAMGCDEAQGYLFSAPVQAKAFAEMFASPAFPSIGVANHN